MIYVVTSAHNRREVTARLIDSLIRQETDERVCLLLVDDGSTDGTADMAAERYPDSVILKGEGNLWWAGALQMAGDWLFAHASDEDAVLINNDDVRYEEDYIDTGLSLLRQYPDTLIAGCGYGLTDHAQLDGIYEHSFRDGTGRLLPPDSEGNCASTRSLFLTVGLWRRIGGFHPHLLPQYFSDFEWTIRAGRKGLGIRSFSQLSYTFDEKETGDNAYDGMTAKKLFSRRSGLNPVYRLTFILLSTPIQYLPSHLWHQAGRYLRRIKEVLAGR